MRQPVGSRRVRRGLATEQQKGGGGGGAGLGNCAQGRRWGERCSAHPSASSLGAPGGARSGDHVASGGATQEGPPADCRIPGRQTFSFASSRLCLCMEGRPWTSQLDSASPDSPAVAPSFCTLHRTWREISTEPAPRRFFTGCFGQLFSLGKYSLYLNKYVNTFFFRIMCLETDKTWR